MNTNRLEFLRYSAAGIAGAAALSSPIFSAARAAAAAGGASSVVLVHGAFANGSSWDKVIPILAAANLSVVAVHLPMSSFADDVATVNRAIADQGGPVVLVGHSYAGMLVTQAGAVDAVRGLVYVSGFAPSEGESVQALLKPYPPPPSTPQIQADKAGYLRLSPAGIAEDFAQDLPAAEQALLAVNQGPIFHACFETPATVAAWKSKPSWAVIPGQDRSIPPALHVATAKKIGAKTTALPASSHVAMLSHPKEVAAVIVSAATAS